jgi:peptidyl-prolyl cis-trans isomerase A (cyclophilin A)
MTDARRKPDASAFIIARQPVLPLPFLENTGICMTRIHNKWLLPWLFLFCCTAASAQDYVCMESNQGDFCIQLFPQSAPQTVANFLRYVNDGDYDNSLIHRSVSNFVIQGGGFTLRNGNFAFVPTDPPVINEYSRSNLRGTVAMAKLGNDPNSATSQWFVNVSDSNTFLNTSNGGFTVFAEVVTGMEVIDRINALRVANLSNAFQNASFAETPVTTPAGINTIANDEFVLITRAYATSRLPVTNPYHCSKDSTTSALTEFCSTYLNFPVQVQGVFYSARLDLQATQPVLTFTVDKGSLSPLAEAPAQFAIFDAASGRITIPTVGVGANLVSNVVLELTDKPSLQFKLLSFDK